MTKLITIEVNFGVAADLESLKRDNGIDVVGYKLSGEGIDYLLTGNKLAPV